MHRRTARAYGGLTPPVSRGLHGEIAGADITSVMRTCQSCGERRAIGAHRAYRTAGVVLRCPDCEDVALVVGVQESRLVLQWRGTFEIER